MAAEDAGTPQERLERADLAATKALAEVQLFTENALQKAVEQYLHDLDSIRPKLAVPSSKEQCLAAAEELIKRQAKLVKKMKKSRKQLMDEDHEVFGRQGTVECIYHRLMQHKGATLSHAVRQHTQRQIDLLSRTDEKRIRLIQTANGTRDGLLIQAEIRKLLENQSQEAQDWVHIHNNSFAKHLQRPNTRPMVLSERRNITPFSVDIPPEISNTLIYSHCDLESAVNLRETCRSWYDSYFHCCESILRTKVKERFPWIHLEDDLRTWADCALVYVKRVTGKRWSVTNDIHKLSSWRTPTQEKPLLVKNLEPDENLHPDFKSFEYTSRKPLSGEISSGTNSEGETMVTVGDLNITLPSGAVVENVETTVFLLYRF